MTIDDRSATTLEARLGAAEAELERTRARLREIESMARLGRWELDLVTMKLSWTPMIFELLELDPTKVEATLDMYLSMVHPDDLPTMTAAFAATITHNTPYDSVHRVITGRGNERWVREECWTIFEGDLPRTSIGVVQDVDALVRANQECAKSEARLRKVFEVLPIGLWFADADGKLLEGNPAGVRIWGAEPKVSIDDYGVFTARRLPSGEEIAPDDWALVHTIRDGVTVVDELLEIDAFDGETRTILNYTAPIHDESGRIQGAVVVNQDVTKEREAEAEEARLQAQLVQAQKMEAIGRLAGGVAHDFNNMLQVILGFAESALRKDVEEGSPLYEKLSRIQRAASHSAELTRQLLAFARQQLATPKQLDLSSAVEELLPILERLIGEHLVIQWEPGDGEGLVHIDPNQVDQILANLVVNARDAISGHGTIAIGVGLEEVEAPRDDRPGLVPGSYVRLTVRDDGVGMDEEARAHIFEPFYTTKPVGEGTGLGMATVFGIVKQNDGFVYVDSVPGEGTTVIVLLPRIAREATDEAPPPRRARSQQGDETILLVEDEAILLEMAREILSELGYHVLSAALPSEAIALAREHHRDIHLLVTDMVMPEMHGDELARAIRALHPETRLLFMTGYAPEHFHAEGLFDKTSNYIAKPFSIGDLEAKVRAALA